MISAPRRLVLSFCLLVSAVSPVVPAFSGDVPEKAAETASERDAAKLDDVTRLNKVVETLRFQLASAEEQVAIWDDQLKLKDGRIEILKNEAEADAAIIARLEDMLELQRSLNDFKENQIDRLQNLLREQRRKVAELSAALEGNPPAQSSEKVDGGE